MSETTEAPAPVSPPRKQRIKRGFKWLGSDTDNPTGMPKRDIPYEELIMLLPTHALRKQTVAAGLYAFDPPYEKDEAEEAED